MPKPDQLLMVEVNVTIHNPINSNERLTFRDERTLAPRSFSEMAAILAAFNELFNKLT